MDKKELVIYEAPTITEFISWGWLQDLVARYIAWTVNRKWDRYQKRLKRAVFINSIRNYDNKSNNQTNGEGV